MAITAPAFRVPARSSISEPGNKNVCASGLARQRWITEPLYLGSLQHPEAFAFGEFDLLGDGFGGASLKLI